MLPSKVMIEFHPCPTHLTWRNSPKENASPSLITLLSQEKREVLWRTCWGTHWELGEHIEKQMRTHWELKGNSGNTLGTREKWKKNPSPPPKLKREKKKARHVECMHGPSHWLHEISLPKRVCHHFWPELIPLQRRTPYLGLLFF